MPNSDTIETQSFNTPSNFQFSGIEIEKLGGTEYTIVDQLIDESSSVIDYKQGLESCQNTILEACKKNPNSEKMLMGCHSFSSRYNQNINEIHGFTPLNSLSNDQYTGSIQPGGMTPLNDAFLYSIESIEMYGTTLDASDFLCNAIIFGITDGVENASRNNAVKIKQVKERIRQGGKIESLKLILIAVNDTECKDELEAFRVEADIDQYISLGDVTPGKLAKLADFISQSISSTSQALNTGGPSQPTNFII